MHHSIGRGFFDVYHFIAFAQGQVDGLAQFVSQSRHDGLGDLAQIRLGVDTVAKTEQLAPKLIFSCGIAFGKSVVHHRIENAKRRRAVQAGFSREDFKADRLRVTGNGIQQVGHSVNDLNLGFLRHKNYVL